MPAHFDASYSLYSPEMDVLSLSSTTTTRRPGSTHTFGSGNNHNTHHVSMHRHLSDSSHQSSPRSPFGYRGDGQKLSPGNIVVLEEEIDPLDKTPQEETVIRFGKDVQQRRPESSMGSSGEVTDDLFPEGSQASSHTSVHEDALRTKSTPASPNPSVTIRRGTTGVIELGPIVEVPGPRSPSLHMDAPSTPGQRVLRKQVPEWTASLENLEQLRITPGTTPRIDQRSALSSSDLLASASNLAVPPLDTRSLSMPAGGPRDDGILARTARRLRLGSKDQDRASGEVPGEISSPVVNPDTQERRRTMPYIPARGDSLTLTGPPAPNTDSMLPQHPFNHFIYAQDYADSDPTPTLIELPPEDPTRRPSDQSHQTFTSGFSLTRLIDESHAPERDTPGRRLAPLPEPLSGYEDGSRFSAQPLGGMSKSFSENYLVPAGPRTNIALERGVSFRRRAVRATKLFTLSESGLTTGTGQERSTSRGKGTPKGSPMLDHDAPFFASPPTPPIPTRSSRPGLFSRTKSSLHVNKNATTSTSDLEPDAGPGLPFTRARRVKTRARHREAAIFAAGPNRLPTTREMLEVGRHQVYDVDGRKVAFGDIIAGGGGQQTVVVFIRHWYCPLCAEYVESIVRSVTPEVLEAANVKLVIIGNGSRRMLPAYSSKVMRCPFEMYTDPKLRVYRGLGMTRQTHDGGEEEDKGDYVTMGSMKGTLAVAKRATKMPLGRPGTIPQLGGEFIFEGALACTYAHRMINTRSHAPIRDVIRLTGARLDFIHTERGPPAPAIHRTPVLGALVETTDGMQFGNWGESGLRLSHEDRRALEDRRISEGEGWLVARENELERIRGERERRRSRLVARGKAPCAVDEGEGMTSGDEVAVRRV